MKLLPNNTTQVANFNSDNKIIKFKIDCYIYYKWGVFFQMGFIHIMRLCIVYI